MLHARPGGGTCRRRPQTCRPGPADRWQQEGRLFAANYAALIAAGVRTPRLLMLDRDGRYLQADLALVEDVGAVTLEALMERDPAAAAKALSTR